MHNGAAGAAQRRKGFLDQLRARLGQHLNGDVVGNALVLDQFTAEIVVVTGCGRKTDLDFLEAYLHQLIPQAGFLPPGHRLDQGLVTIAQVNAAPAWRPGNLAVGPAARRQAHGCEGRVFAMIELAHGPLSSVHFAAHGEYRRLCIRGSRRVVSCRTSSRGAPCLRRASPVRTLRSGNRCCISRVRSINPAGGRIAAKMRIHTRYIGV